MSEFYDQLKREWGFKDGEEPPRKVPLWTMTDGLDYCPKCCLCTDDARPCPNCGRPGPHCPF